MAGRQQLDRSPVPVTPQREIGSLLRAVAQGDPRQTPNWKHGVIKFPEAVPAWRTVAACDPGEADYGVKTIGDPAPYGAVPFDIQTLTRRPRTLDLDELNERARRQITSITSQAIGRELWTGDLTRATPWEQPDDAPYVLANPRSSPDDDPASNVESGPWCNPYLAAAEMLPAEAHPVAAVGAVEAAASALTTGTVFIHVPPWLILELSNYGVRAEGYVLRTPLGSVIVADTGYPGVLDPADPIAVYATGPVEVFLDDPVVYGRPEQVIDFDNNQIGVWAARSALVSFDPQTLVGCEVEEQ